MIPDEDRLSLDFDAEVIAGVRVTPARGSVHAAARRPAEATPAAEALS
jgi:hypothetical protein